MAEIQLLRSMELCSYSFHDKLMRAFAWLSSASQLALHAAATLCTRSVDIGHSRITLNDLKKAGTDFPCRAGYCGGHSWLADF